jgi:hypothetical protein
MIHPGWWRTENGPKSGLFFRCKNSRKIGPEPKSRKSRESREAKSCDKKIRPTKVVSLIVVLILDVETVFLDDAPQQRILFSEQIILLYQIINKVYR